MLVQVRRPPLPAQSLGFTMIELLVVVAICAVLLGLVVPSLRSWIVSQRVISTTGEILSDLRFARSEAMASNSTVVVVFNNGAGNGCYTVFRSPDISVSDLSGLTCDCAKGAGSACEGTETFKELKTFALPAGADVSISGPVGEIYRSSQNFNNFDVAANTGMKVRVTATGGKELNIVTSAVTPRPGICAPAGSQIIGYKPCP